MWFKPSYYCRRKVAVRNYRSDFCIIACIHNGQIKWIFVPFHVSQWVPVMDVVNIVSVDSY